LARQAALVSQLPPCCACGMARGALVQLSDQLHITEVLFNGDLVDGVCSRHPWLRCWLLWTGPPRCCCCGWTAGVAPVGWLPDKSQNVSIFAVPLAAADAPPGGQQWAWRFNANSDKIQEMEVRVGPQIPFCHTAASLEAKHGLVVDQIHATNVTLCPGDYELSAWVKYSADFDGTQQVGAGAQFRSRGTGRKPQGVCCVCAACRFFIADFSTARQTRRPALPGQLRGAGQSSRMSGRRLARASS
jgi:hypothetical protein